MGQICKRCSEKNPAEARYCTACGSPLVPPQEFPDINRVVITGIGVYHPLGLTLAENWEALLSGKSGAALTTRMPNIDKYPCNFSCQVKGFDPQAYMDPKDARRMTEVSHYAVAAAKMAYEDASLSSTDIDPARSGVVLGTAAGGSIVETERGMRNLLAGKKISPILLTRSGPTCLPLRWRACTASPGITRQSLRPALPEHKPWRLPRMRSGWDAWT